MVVGKMMRLVLEALSGTLEGPGGSGLTASEVEAGFRSSSWRSGDASVRLGVLERAGLVERVKAAGQPGAPTEPQRWRITASGRRCLRAA